MSNSDIEQIGTVKGHLPNGANLSGRISNGLSLSGHISIGSVASDFIIKMTVESDDNGNYTIESCDATIEQIDAAVAAEKRVVLIASFSGIVYELPMIQHIQGTNCIFSAFSSGMVIYSSVYKVENKSEWNFDVGSITADNVDYSNDALPNISTVGEALDELVPKSHTHANKAVLDKFTETDGKPTYDGETLGSDFVIKMTVTSDDNGNYTVASCDATVEQIDAAITAEKRVVVIASVNAAIVELPMLEGIEGYTYYFGMFLQGQVILSFVQKVAENESEWRFGMGQILSGDVGYSNDALPNISSVEDALNKLIPKSHTHSNKPVLDKFAESDGKPTYNGEALGSGAGDFIIKMTIEVDKNNYTVTSCDKTTEQIDAAVASGQNIKAIAFDKFVMPLTQIMENGVSYTFGAFLGMFLAVANVNKNPESGADEWEFYFITLAADIVEYSNDAIPNISTVSEALDELIPKSHTHANKDTLDKLSVSNGKLQYNGSDVGLKPVKGTDYWTVADKQEIVNDTLAALPTWTGGSY